MLLVSKSQKEILVSSILPKAQLEPLKEVKSKNKDTIPIPTVLIWRYVFRTAIQPTFMDLEV